MGRFFSMDNKFLHLWIRWQIFVSWILSVWSAVFRSLLPEHLLRLCIMWHWRWSGMRKLILFGAFKSFKDNFKQATIINLIMIAVGAVLYLDLNVAKNMPGSAGQIFHVIFMAFVIIYYVLFYMFIRFLPGFTIRSVIRSKMHCSWQSAIFRIQLSWYWSDFVRCCCYL